MANKSNDTTSSNQIAEQIADEVQNVVTHVREDLKEMGSDIGDQIQDQIQRSRTRRLVIMSGDGARVIEIPLIYGLIGGAIFVLTAPPRLLVTIALGLMFARMQVSIEDGIAQPVEEVTEKVKTAAKNAKRRIAVSDN